LKFLYLNIDKITNESTQETVLKFSVLDTGIGITQDKQQILFQAFSQADTTTTREYGGTGLGLIIANQLVELMSGSKIQLSSKYGAGSCFSFTLPLMAAEQPKRATKIDISSMILSLKGKHLLVVDDSNINVKLMSHYLDNVSIKYTHTSSGTQALELLKTYSYDAVLLDMQIPDKNGYEVMQAIRTQDNFKHLQTDKQQLIIAVDTDDSKQSQEKCLSSGADYFLSKPIIKYDLYKIVYKCVANYSTKASAESYAIVSTNYNILAGKKILVAEDDLINSKLISHFLHNLQVNITNAADGEQALNMLKHHTYDIMLLDIQMPKKDGLAVMRTLKEDSENIYLPKGSNMQIIAFTANVMEEDRKQYITAGAQYFIPKPIRKKDFLRIIQQACET
jgi:two-component system, sensor histidine kinase and response regulator